MEKARDWILERTDEIQKAHPRIYGTKGARKGSYEYVPGGWQKAMKLATKQYYEEFNRTPSRTTLRRKELGSIAQRLKSDPNQDALYRGYKQKLKELKTKYWNAGLQIKAVKPASPKRQTRNGTPYVRKRLPAVILPVGKTVSSSVKMQQPTSRFPLPLPKNRVPTLPALQIPTVELPSTTLRVRKRTGPTLIKPSRNVTPKRTRKLDPEEEEVLHELD